MNFDSFTINDFLKSIISVVITQVLIWILPLIFKNFSSLYIRIILFFKKIKLLLTLKILFLLAAIFLVYFFTKNIFAIITVSIITVLIIIIRELILKRKRGLLFFCGYFLLDERDNFRITKDSNSINAGLQDYIQKNVNAYDEFEIFKDFLNNFKKINILRFASGLNLDEFRNYLEIKFNRSFPIKIMFGYMRKDNIFSKFLSFDENSQKMESATLDEYFTLYPKHVKQINDFYAIGELLALFHIFYLFTSSSFSIFYFGDKFNSIRILNDLDYLLSRERKYFEEKLDKLEYITNKFDSFEHIVHEQKAYFHFQENHDYENSAKEIEKALLYKLHGYKDDEEFINYLTTSYCIVLNKSKKALEFSNFKQIDELSESDIKAPLMFLAYSLSLEIKDYSIITDIFEKLLSKYKDNKIIYYFYGLSFYSRSIKTKSLNMLISAQKYFKKALDLNPNFLLAKNKLFWSKIAKKSDFFGENSPEIIGENAEEQCKLLLEFEDYFLLIGETIRTNKN